MNIQKPSFSIDDSQLSLFVNLPKSQAQVKCQQLMKQSSQYRSLIRQLKQDNQWLRTANQGLQNQCSTIKQILQQKKNLLIQINSDLRLANQQINRLQDQIIQKGEQIQQLKAGIIKSKQELLTKNQTIMQVQAQLLTKRSQIQTLLKEKQIYKNDLKIKEEKYFMAMQQKMLTVFQKYDEQYAKQYRSSGLSTKNYEQMLNQITSRLQKHLKKQNKTNADHAEQMRKVLKQKEENAQNIQILEMQLKQMNELMGKNEEESAKKARKIADLQQKMQAIEKSYCKNIEQLSQNYQQSLTKILNVFNPLMGQCKDQFAKIGQLVRNNKNQYQLELVLQQIKPIIKSYSQQKQQRVRNSKCIKQWQTKVKQIQQEYDMLKLRHLTLQRQYQAVVDDNRRILKFNQLSRYRTQRNNKSINKQNLPNIGNSHTKQSAYKK